MDDLAAENANLRTLVYYAWQELVRHGETTLTKDLLKAAWPQNRSPVPDPGIAADVTKENER